MTLEEQIKLHKYLSRQIEALEAQKKQLTASILCTMPVQPLRLGPYPIKRCPNRRSAGDYGLCERGS